MSASLVGSEMCIRDRGTSPLCARSGGSVLRSVIGTRSGRGTGRAISGEGGGARATAKAGAGT
eukprot:6747357-Alexandrium_andersonii.AAC.1